MTDAGAPDPRHDRLLRGAVGGCSVFPVQAASTGAALLLSRTTTTQAKAILGRGRPVWRCLNNSRPLPAGRPSRRRTLTPAGVNRQGVIDHERSADSDPRRRRRERA